MGQLKTRLTILNTVIGRSTRTAVINVNGGLLLSKGQPFTFTASVVLLFSHAS